MRWCVADVVCGGGGCRKIRREVVEKERSAHATLRKQGVHKVIDRTKVEHNLKEFVRHSIRRLHTQHAGGGA